MLAMLVYNMSKAVLHSTPGEVVGQGLLCSASFWNAMVNRRRTNGGVNCLRPKIYKLHLPGPIPSMLGALGLTGGHVATVYTRPLPLSLLCCCCCCCCCC